MIIFYKKITREIIGQIRDRINTESHLKMWIGDKNETERLIVQWQPYKWFDKKSNIIPNDCLDACDEEGNLLVTNADFEPDHPQKELFIELDKNPSKIYGYKVDLNNNLVKI